MCLQDLRRRSRAELNRRRGFKSEKNNLMGAWMLGLFMVGMIWWAEATQEAVMEGRGEVAGRMDEFSAREHSSNWEKDNQEKSTEYSKNVNPITSANPLHGDFRRRGKLAYRWEHGRDGLVGCETSIQPAKLTSGVGPSPRYNNSLMTR